MPLIDQHCHGVATADVDVREWLSEAKSARRHPFRSLLGVSLRRWCAPVLGMESHAPAEDYLWRRAELGWHEASRRLLAAAGVKHWFVDTGYAPGPVTTPGLLAELGGGTGHEVMRIESVAETLSLTAASPEALLNGILTQLHRAPVIAFKSVIGYRMGLRLPTVPPDRSAVVQAAGNWLRVKESRLTDPVLLTWLVHEAARAGYERGLPLQFHTGFGDSDLRLSEVDPVCLTDFIRAVPVPTVLLHCYPFHRNAAYLAHVFDHVYVDLGLTVPFVGPRAGAVLAEVLELAPFDSVLYSSDGNVLPELHFLGAALWRSYLGKLVDSWLADDVLTPADAERLVLGIGYANAARLHRL
ncbi:amidohydrolase family protein [Actinophytocola oryzae]|uniref:amidohydrolase family protein n=1 Tax=Actinophytocola oryzae TaxID=502181 RepID=UPI001FBAAB12|nr:amidohydrolase family protein [Actinophytocola oryzae]